MFYYATEENYYILDEECKMYDPSLFIEKKIYLTYKPVIQRYLGTLLLCQ